MTPIHTVQYQILYGNDPYTVDHVEVDGDKMVIYLVGDNPKGDAQHG